MCLEVDGNIFSILWFQHHKMAAADAVYRVKLKNLRTGSITERSFRSGEKFERVTLEKSRHQFLYKDAQGYHFMDNETYEQAALSEKVLGEAVKYLSENMEVELASFEGDILGVELPVHVELRVVETEPGLRGDTAQGGGMKPAKLSTGVVIQVPLFVNVGDVIRLKTETGEYEERVL